MGGDPAAGWRRSEPARGMFAQVQIGPERSDDIPDEPAVRLVIVHPQFRHARGDFDSRGGSSSRPRRAAGRGTAHRLNRNMIVFLAADAKRYEELDDAVRQYLAWTGPRRDRGADQGTRAAAAAGGAGTQAAQGRRRDREPADLGQLPVAARPVQTTSRPLRIDELKADTNRDRLAERASDRLKNADMLRVVQGAQNIRLNLDQHLSSVWSIRPHRGRQAVGVLLPVPLPAPAGRAIGAGERHPGRLQPGRPGTRTASRSRPGTTSRPGGTSGSRIPHEDMPPQLSDTTLLVRPDRATRQRERERAEQEAARAAAAAAAAAAAPVLSARYRRRRGTGSGDGRGFRRRARSRRRIDARAVHPAARHAPGGSGPARSPGTQEHPLLRHRPPRPGALRPRHQPPVPGGHPAPRRPRRRGPGDHRRDHRRSRRTASPTTRPASSPRTPAP